MSEGPELERAIKRIISRILTQPVSAELLDRMRAYGSPEKLLNWWLRMSSDYIAYAKSLTNKEIAESIDYNAASLSQDHRTIRR
jgi:hypothetical protein